MSQEPSAYELTIPATPRPMGEWRDQGACKGQPQHIFYPEKGAIPHEAKRICASCPVKSECLEWAVSLPERHGVWAGTTERQRRNGIRVRECANCGETFHFPAKAGMNIPKTCSDACRIQRHSMQKQAAAARAKLRAS